MTISSSPNLYTNDFIRKVNAMSIRLSLRQCCFAMLLSMTMILLSACADGEAHLNVNLDGSSDLTLKLGVTDSALGKIGQDNLLPLLGDALKRNGFTTEVTTGEERSQLTAKAHYESKGSTDFDLSNLPAGIQVDHSVTPGFFFNSYHISAVADPMESMPDGEIKDQISKVPEFLRKLLLKDVNFDFKLTLPIKAKDSNADEVEDRGKTLVWHVDPLGTNTLDMTVQVPNIRNIIIITAIGLALIAGLLTWWLVRRKRNKGRHQS